MTDKKINDLTLATGNLLDTMQLETDIGGVTANKVTLLQIKSYVHIDTAVESVTGDIVNNSDSANPIINQSAITTLGLNQTGLAIKGGSTNKLTIKPNETLSAARTLNVIVNDADKTVNMGGNIVTGGALTLSGAFGTTLTVTGTTGVTLPTSGTLAVNGAIPAATISGTQTFADNVLTGAEIKDYSETTQAVSAVTNLTIDYTLGGIILLSQDTATTLTISNPSPTGKACRLIIIRTKDNTATARAITWPTGTIWTNGVVPTLSSTANAVDIFSLLTTNAGTTWYGFTGGQAFA